MQRAGEIDGGCDINVAINTLYAAINGWNKPPEKLLNIIFNVYYIIT